MKRMVGVVLLVLVVFAVSAAWALDKGEKAPPLTIKPVNTDDGEKDIIAGIDGTVVLAFINGTQIKDDVPQELSDLIKDFDALHKANKEGVFPYMVVVGDYTEDQIKAWAERNQLTVPIALKHPDDAELPKWKLSPDDAAVLYLIGKDDAVDEDTTDQAKFDEVFQEAEK